MHRQTSLIPFVRLNRPDPTAATSEPSLVRNHKKITHVPILKRSRSLWDDDLPRICNPPSTEVAPTERVSEVSSSSSFEDSTKSAYKIGGHTLTGRPCPLLSKGDVILPQACHSSYDHAEHHDNSKKQPIYQERGEYFVQDLDSEEEEHETVATILNLKRLHQEHQPISSSLSPKPSIVITPGSQEEAPCPDPFLSCETSEPKRISSRSTVKVFDSWCAREPSQHWPRPSLQLPSPSTTPEEKSVTKRLENKRNRNFTKDTALQLTQTFLDFGQTSAVELAKTCPHCGMLFTEVEEDTILHRRLCSRLRSQRGIKVRKKVNKESCSAGTGEKALPLVQTGEAVRVLDFLSEKLRTRTKNGLPVCERITENPKKSLGKQPDQTMSSGWGRDLYILRCDRSLLMQTPEAVYLLESLGFLDTFFDSADYIVVVVSSRALKRVLCAVAGCSHTREQDPQLELRPQHASGGDGVRCLTRRCFTFCDVNYVWLASESAIEKQARSTALENGAYGSLLTREAHQDNPFIRAEGRAKQRENGMRLALEEVNKSLAQALVELGTQVAYGHVFSPLMDFSYSKQLFATDSSNTLKASLSMKERLSCCMKNQISTDFRHDAASDDDNIGDELFLHSENSRSYSISEDDNDRNSTLLEVEESIQSVLSVISSQEGM
ncbi:unnamed protein product [Phytomonas sp. EM1]|nr:unnamed protein product [Phytomonas sp. EM1]|eukprot:CCW64020.1 unnamed protein product [Phytomonas sp. isolate EM1]